MQAEGLQFISKPYSSVDLQQALDHAARMAVPSNLSFLRPCNQAGLAAFIWQLCNAR